MLPQLSPNDASILSVIAQFVANHAGGRDMNSPRAQQAHDRVFRLYDVLSVGVPRHVARELLERAKLDTANLADTGPVTSKEHADDLTRKLAAWAGL